MDNINTNKINPILIIEDDIGLSILISDILEDIGYSILQAYDGNSGLQALENNPVELMLLDFSLPNMSGLELLEALEKENIPIPPFIVVTGAGDEELAVEMMKSGASDYLTKNSQLLTLLPSVVNSVLRENTSKRKLAEAEKALRESEAYNKILFQESPLPMVVLDPGNLQFIDSNNAAAKICNFEDRQSLIGKTILDISASSQYEKEASKGIFVNYIKQAQNKRSVRFQWQCQYPDGKMWDAEVLLMVINYKNKELLQFSLQDITAQLIAKKNKEKLELQHRQSQKMEAIGVLTGGIAHEFNNLLSPILGFTEILMNENSVNTSDLKRLTHIKNAGNRAKNLVKQLLAYGQHSISTKSLIIIEDLIDNTIEFMKNTIPRNIYINKEIEHGLPAVEGIPNDIRQILINLCINASQAMPNGGTLTIQLNNTDYNNFVSLSGEEIKGKFICLTVKDTGVGIKKDKLEQIYDPFYTTREVGQGSGLGLSVVLGIVAQHGGHIDVDSKESVGTNFKVYLPVTEGKAAIPVEKDVEFHKGHEHILLIDDELTIISLIKSMLEPLGYKVTGIQDPEVALKIFRDNSQNFDLILTDYGMPKLNGKQLAELVKATKPEIPVILTTGYSNLARQDEVKNWNIEGILMKPFQYKELSNTIRTVLEKST